MQALYYKRNYIFILFSILIFLLSGNSLNSSHPAIEKSTLTNIDRTHNNSPDALINEPLFHSLYPDFKFNSIRSIFKDYLGFMWFGTSEGLVKYDGINFTVYNHNPNDSLSLSHNMVSAIVEDKYNNLWVGTFNGLNMYNREKDNFQRTEVINNAIDHISEPYVTLITDIAIYKNSILFIGTYNNGVIFYDIKENIVKRFFNDPDDPNSISSNNAENIAIDNENNIWIGTYDGLNKFHYDEEKFERFYSEPGNENSLSGNHISSLTIDKQGNIWAGTQENGINKLAKKNNHYQITQYQKGDMADGNLSGNYILSLLACENDYLWIGTDNEGLNRLDLNTGTIDLFKTEPGNENSIISNTVRSIYSDNEGRIWFGTFNRGVCVFDNNFKRFESYRKNILSKKKLVNKDVTGFTEDNNGNIWLSTDGGGICKFDPVKQQLIKTIFNDDNNMHLSTNAVQDILFDANNNLWAGTWLGGIDLLDKEGNRIKNYKLNFSKRSTKNSILNLYEDPENTIWAGTSGHGLYRYDPETDIFEPVRCTNDSTVISSTSHVTSMLVDNDGTFWVGTLYGLAVLDWDKEKKYSSINYLPHCDSLCISSYMIDVLFEDSRNRLWVGTFDRGLNMFNKEDSTFISIREKDGLISNSIKGIQEDDDGDLWISTNRGISRFNYDEFRFKNYTKEDGLNSDEFLERSTHKAKDGKLYFGNKDGFNAFYPDKIKSNPHIPNVVITQLYINNNTATIGDDDSPLSKNISLTEEIILRHDQSSISIDFVALNYTNPSKNQYRYKLEGFDQDWNYIGNKRTAIYTNIMPGKYIFKVMGSNNDGIWNETPTELNIIIRPPFWKTWWAYSFYILIFIGIVIGALKIYLARLKMKNQIKLEQLAKKKIQELNESNIKFFTNISHEFRTPLSLITAILENMIPAAKAKTKEQLHVIQKNAAKLEQLTNNLLDLRKLEDGITKLEVQKGDITSLVKEISSYFCISSERKNIEFNIETNKNSIYGWFDPEKIESTLFNLLSNAFKNTSINGKIDLIINIHNGYEINQGFGEHVKNIHPNASYLLIRVRDNGKGISHLELPYIFDKFYMVKSSGKKKSSGTGIGLTLAKGLIEMHHGSIWAESEPGKGTTFSFVIPVNHDFYKDDEIIEEPKSILKKTVIDIPKEKSPQHNEQEKEDQNREKDIDQPEILIVEDDEELRTFLANELSNKHKIILAKDGKEGIDIAQREIPDLIVSDVIMPNSSGIELCEIIKSDIRTSHIPVILLTAKSALNEQIEGIETGADAYITKPFSIQYLIVQVNQLIRSRRELYSHFSKDVYIMPNKMAKNTMDQEFLKKVTGFIVSNITDESMNVEVLAEHLCISRSNVYRKIKALTGKSIVEFIRIIRLKQALKLMEENKHSIAEIAYQTGFSSPSYFTKTFKEQYGKPPSEYLSKAKE